MQPHGLRKEEVEEFQTEFEGSGQSSVDAFLEKRTAFERIGKLAIAERLCRTEAPGRLFSTQGEGNWYRALWNEITRGVVNPGGVAARVNFLTFNYDRSLEFFLFNAAKRTYNTADDYALSFVKKFHVIHLYGSLGDFHYEPSDAVRLYQEQNTVRDIEIAAKGIRIIPEGRDKDDRLFQTGRTLFEHADLICFLGFGFDPINVERLGLSWVLEWKKQRKQPMPRIIISAMGKSEKQIARIKGELCGTAEVEIEAYPEDSLRTLQEAGVIR